MAAQYLVSVRLDSNVAGYLRGMRQSEQATRGWAQATRREVEAVKQAFGGLRGMTGGLAGLGAGAGLVGMSRIAAQVDKQLTQIRLTAGMSAKEQVEAYQELFALVRANGGVLEDTLGGFNNLIQAGLNYRQAMESSKAISAARGVTGAGEQALSSALTVASANFNFDLAKPGKAVELLDKMTVAGRKGNAELENLSDIFSRVAPRANAANFGFEKTLAFIEGLSQFEKQPERLATLVDSSLRLFTNANYAKDAERATGVRFFDKGGARRDPIAVLQDLRTQYQKLTTDAQRFAYVSKAFGKTDLDTQRGLQSLLGSDALDKMREFEDAIINAGGTLARDLGTATSNAVDQASRLKNTLRQAGEEFAAPINQAFSKATKYALDSKQQGGLGLSGGDLMAGGAAAAAGLFALSRVLPPVVGRLMGRAGGLGAGVATGKAMEAIGVQPVYVTNWAEMGGGGGGLGAAAGAAAGAGAAGAAAKGMSLLNKGKAALAVAGAVPLSMMPAAMTAGGVGLAAAGGAAAGYGLYRGGLAGTGAGDALGGAVARVMALFGSNEAKQAVAINDAIRNSKVGGEITVRVSGTPGLAVQAETNPLPGTRMQAGLGRTNLGAGM